MVFLQDKKDLTKKISCNENYALGATVMSNESRQTIQKKQTCIGQTYAKITGLCIDTFVWTVPKSVGCTIIMVHTFASLFIVLISIEEKKVA